MRIAFLTHQFPRMPNTFILNEIIEIVNMGHRVTIYSLDRPRDELIQPQVFHHGLMDLTRYVLDFVREAPSNSSQFQAYGRHGLDPHLHALGSICDQLLEEGTQLIHAAFGNRPCTAALALAEATGLPMTFESHARDLFVDFPMAREKIARAERIFTISDYNKRYLMEEHGCPQEKIIVRRVSIQEAFCDSLSGEHRDENLIVSVCRLHPTKGIEYALQAMPLILETHPEVRLRVIGEGELREDLEELARELGIADHVSFAGPMTNREALEEVSRAAVFLLPSVIAEDGDRDGIPTALIEAMYLQTPGVSTRVSGIPELIEDGENGFLVDPGDVIGLATRVRFLLDRPERRWEMGRRARQKVKSEFDAFRNTKKVVDAWTEILDHG